jgi:hypothetical protein
MKIFALKQRNVWLDHVLSLFCRKQSFADAGSTLFAHFVITFLMSFQSPSYRTTLSASRDVTTQ